MFELFNIFINLKIFIMKTQILNIGKALSRAEQKQVFGGRMLYNGGCAFQGGNGYYGQVGANYSLEYVQAGADLTGGHYCCDSCCTASWLNQDMKEELGC